MKTEEEKWLTKTKARQFNIVNHVNYDCLRLTEIE